jgi:maltose alpha-D-glucosyltransferase/alpha-amylase
VALQDRPTLVLFDGWTSFFRDRVMPWRIGMAERMRTQFETDTLPRHIEIQRWYGAKGVTIERARLVDSAIWDANEFSWMLPILKLDGPAEASTYFMPLALAWEDRDEERIGRLTPAALAKVRQQANVGIMGDAFYDPAFCRALVQAIGAGTEIATAAGQLRFTPTTVFADFTADIASLPVSHPSTTSSNTVVNIDEKLFLKGYRRLREGLNPELEMGRFLTEVVHYPHCVPVLGALEYFMNDGGVMTLALVQGYVANQGDGWDYTLGYVERFLEEQRTAAGPALTPAEAHGGFLALAATLGRRTAELHRALARRTGDPAFDPEAFTADDMAAITAQATSAVNVTLSLLRERLTQLPPAAQDDAQIVLTLHDALQSRMATRLEPSPGCVKIRIHGDYHLGQVLVTGNDFVLVDFEGEPARTFDERRAKNSHLRDVAGMLRSFNYARWSALKRVAQNADELRRLEPAVLDWERATRAAFLAAYTEATALADAALPVDAALLDVFELEKALYELRYEISHRLDWAQVPLRGILALMKPGTAH